MALPTYSKSIGTVFTIAARQHLKTIVTDNFYVKCPAFEHLRSKKQSKVRGGETLVIPVNNGAEPLGGAYAKADSLTMQDSEVLTEAQFNWAFYYEPVVVFHQDMWKARGDTAILDIVKVKTEQAVMKLKRKLYQGIYLASPTSIEIQGLNVAIPTSPSSSGTYGNLDGGATAQSWWRNYAESGGSVASGAALTALTTLFREIADNSSAGKPTAAFTDPTTWARLHNEVIGHYETHADVTQRAKQFADLGFEVISFMGVPIVSDPFCTAGVIFAINDEATQLVEMADAAFQLHPDGFVSDLPNRQMAWTSAVIWNGQMATSERRGLGKVYSITA